TSNFINLLSKQIRGSPEEEREISKFELNDQQPDGHFRIIVCTEVGSSTKNISIEVSNGNKYGMNCGKYYGYNNHPKVKWNCITIDMRDPVTGGYENTWIKIYYSKCKMFGNMSLIKTKLVDSTKIASLNRKSFVFYWASDKSEYFLDAYNRPTPNQLMENFVS
ncbi:hypothetical protein DICPUDRAFT_79465, partial [Dictyostelium purpureum]